MTDTTATLSKGYTFVWSDSIRDINQSDWDLLARETATPFLDWEWLRLLEDSGSASPATGWHPRHLAVYRSGSLVAAAPLFVKTHSEGEFVFDQFLAQLASRTGLAYYPKLVGTSPFTPIEAYRFLQDPELDQGYLTVLMQEEIDRFCAANNIRGCHYQFLEQGWGEDLQGAGFIPWIHPGFVWENRGFETFDDFLACFRSSRRKNIKRERRKLADQGLKIEAISGAEIQERHLFWMYRFYLHTNQKYFPWSCRFLTREFFLGLENKLRSRILLILARKQGREEPVGMSMLAFKGDRLYGRYWGGIEGIPFLHFNLCYYEPIQWAIQNGIQQFDPGMGGEHKLHRGFELVPRYSLHRLYTHNLQYMLEVYLQEVNWLQKLRMQKLNQEYACSKMFPGGDQI